MPVVFKNKSFDPAANPADIYDSGNSDSASIKPVNNGDNINEGTFRRPSENLRLRTEELKRNVEKYETILQSAGFLTYSYHEAVQPATVLDSTVEIEWVAADSTFYVRPSTNSVLTILGAVVPGMKYAIDRSAFVSFYGSNVSAGNNPKLGLQNPGDSLSFRLPMLSATEAASNDLALTAANTSNPAIDSAVFDTTLYDLVSNPITGASGDNALFKSPSKYKLKITTKNDANGAALKAALAGALSSGHTVELNKGAEVYRLDESTYSVDEGNTLVVTLLEDNRAYFPFDVVNDDDLILVNNVPYQGPDGGAQASWSSIVVETEGAPPEEFLIPIASYTGSKVVVHGIGSVDADDIKNAANSTVTLSNTGLASTELGGAIESYESTFRLSTASINASNIKNDLVVSGVVSTLAIPISLDIPEVPTGREYYLESVDIYSRDTGDSSKPVSFLSIRALKSYHGVTGAANLTTDILGKDLLASQALGNVESTSLVGNNSSLQLGFYDSLESRNYSSTAGASGNLIIETEADRERSFLLVSIGTPNASYTVLTASFDLFFRLTFKTVHGNELPLLASYVPS